MHLSVGLSAGNRLMYFNKIWHLRILAEFVDKFEFWLKSDENYKCLTSRLTPTYASARHSVVRHNLLKPKVFLTEVMVNTLSYLPCLIGFDMIKQWEFSFCVTWCSENGLNGNTTPHHYKDYLVNTVWYINAVYSDCG